MDSSEATSIGVSSARAIAQLVRIHQHEYGMSRSHIFALYAVNLALFVLLEHQQQRGDRERDQDREKEPDTTFDPFDPDFVALASAFSVITGRSALGQEVRSIFKQSMQQAMTRDGKRGTRRLSRSQLPEELKEILRDDDQSDDTEEEESAASERRESGASARESGGSAGKSEGDSGTDEESQADTTSEQEQEQEQGSMALCEMLCRYEVLSLGKEERNSQEGEETT